MDDSEMEENPDDLITSSEVAEIWSKRAAMMGYQRRYNRRSVNFHCTHPRKDGLKLHPAQITPWGNLFTRQSAWEFPISPQIGRKALQEGQDDVA